MIRIDYEKMTFLELIKLINNCRQELWDRGTRTKFREIHATTGKIMTNYYLTDDNTLKKINKWGHKNGKNRLWIGNFWG